jgi:hypothetical protein
MVIFKGKNNNAGEDTVKQEPLYTVGGNANSTAFMESSVEISQKTKDRTAI